MRRFAAPPLLLALTVITLAPACGRDASGTAGRNGGGLKSSQMLINGIGQGMTETEVRGLLGPPSSTAVPFYAFMAEDSLVVWQYSGLRIEFVDQVVDRLICTGQSGHCVTADGIRVGDSRGRVLAVYGPAERLVRPLGDLLLYHHAEIPCTMMFGLRHGVVSRIEVACEEEE